MTLSKVRVDFNQMYNKSCHSAGHNPRREKMSTKKKAKATHPLLTKEIATIPNWNQWLIFWQSADNLQWMESLLHCGFGVSFDQYVYGEKKCDNVDRVMFYLAVADGWDDCYDSLQLPEDRGKEYCVGFTANGTSIRKSPGQLRGQLARKAFDMLCLNFFRVELRGGGRDGFDFGPVWLKTITSERLFPVIQDFFRGEEARHRNQVRVRNLSGREERSHNEALAVAFLLNLVRFVWGWRKPTSWAKPDEDTERLNTEVRSRLDASKPWLVEVLVALGRLDVLRDWILELDKDCIAKLTEIALSSRFSRHKLVTKDCPVTTLDEACYIDSTAAWFLKEYELKMREHARFEEIRRAEEEMEKASRRIKELGRKK